VGAGVSPKVVHGLQTGQPVLRSLALITPQAHTAQVVTGGQFSLQRLQVEPCGIITPHGQLAGTVGHVGAAVVVVGAGGQLILQRLHVDPVGITIPQGQFVGTGGHVLVLRNLELS
jgi:hypothetical protein